MKVRWSPLISQASGATGPIVASRWRGIDYIRERIVPANPKSADQMTQRNFLTKCVAWWHDLEEQVQDYCKLLVLGEPMSGFNAFTKRNLKDMADEVECRIMPLNAVPNPITTLAGVAGAATKEISLTWVQGEADPADSIYCLAGEIAEAGDIPANLALSDTGIATAGTEACTAIMGKADQLYAIWALVEHEEDSSFSIAAFCEATSKA